MKTSAATTPTKIAAIISMVSMKRSAKRGGVCAPRNSGPAGLVSDIIALDAMTAAKPPPSTEVRLRCDRHDGRSRCASIRSLVLGKRGGEVLPDRVGVAAGLLHVVGPFLPERLGRLLPLVELRAGDGVDLMARHRLDLLKAGAFEIGP